MALGGGSGAPQIVVVKGGGTMGPHILVVTCGGPGFSPRCFITGATSGGPHVRRWFSIEDGAAPTGHRYRTGAVGIKVGGLGGPQSRDPFEGHDASVARKHEARTDETQNNPMELC